MTANYLEELVAEWYEFQGYFVRRNIKVGKRAAGGYDCELDVVAFHPERKHLVHIEPSMDADSWKVRETRYKKKFAAGKKHVPKIFKGIGIPAKYPIEQIALLVFASKKNRQTLAGGQIVLLPELLQVILTYLKEMKLESRAVPEHLPILRTLQVVSTYRATVAAVWDAS